MIGKSRLASRQVTRKVMEIYLHDELYAKIVRRRKKYNLVFEPIAQRQDIKGFDSKWQAELMAGIKFTSAGVIHMARRDGDLIARVLGDIAVIGKIKFNKAELQAIIRRMKD